MQLDMYTKHDIALLKKLTYNWGRNIFKNIPQVLANFVKASIPPSCLFVIQMLFT